MACGGRRPLRRSAPRGRRAPAPHARAHRGPSLRADHGRRPRRPLRTPALPQPPPAWAWNPRLPQPSPRTPGSRPHVGGNPHRPRRRHRACGRSRRPHRHPQPPIPLRRLAARSPARRTRRMGPRTTPSSSRTTSTPNCATSASRCPPWPHSPGTHRAAGHLLLGYLPSIACGYLVVPPRLRPAVDRVREVFGQPVGAIPRPRSPTILPAAHDATPAACAAPINAAATSWPKRLAPSMAPNSFPSTVVSTRYCCVIRPLSPCRRPRHQTHPLRDWGGADAEDGVVLGFGHLSDAELRESLSAVAAALRE